jgi:hypothetical protein
MNIGSIYTVKKFYWFLFPTKKIVAHGPGPHATAPHPAAASYWSKFYNCEVTYFSPNEYIVFLEEEGELKNVLTSDGRIGWIWFTENYNDCFEEVKTEQ